MVQYLGDFDEDATVYIPFNTFTSDDPSASATITNLADADIKVHKDGGTTEIATDGATVAINFDSITGNHLITVDTSAHADYSTGSDYLVRIEGTTVDGATINAWVGHFSIENRHAATQLAALVSSLATAQADLDTLTGTDGATLATVQGNYAPAKAGDSMALVNGAITDASLAGNMEIVFETDFATNYNTTRNAWVTNAQDFVGTTASDPFNAQVVAASITGVTFPTNFADFSITATTGRVDVASVAGTAQTAGDISGLVTTVDTVVDAIKAKTDSLNFSVAGEVNANTRYINGAQVVGDGNATPWDGA